MPTRNAIIAWIAAGSALAGLMLYPVQTIEVRSRQTDKVMAREKIKPGDRFTFAYIHSIENIPVEGIFEVQSDGALRVVETRFPSYGAGLPNPAAGKAEDGKWMAAPAEQELTEFSFYISPINQSSLRIGNKTLDLNRRMESGDIVVVAVRRYPLLLVRLDQWAGY
jgi:hypothetical protein